MKRFAIALALGAGLVLTTAVTAADDPVASRQAIMKDVGAAMGVLGRMAKGQADFSAPTAELALRVIHTASHGYGELFPEGSAGDSGAAEAIWTDPDGFWAEIVKLQEATAAAIAAPPADAEALGPIMGSVGAVCGSCHEGYRVKRG